MLIGSILFGFGATAYINYSRAQVGVQARDKVVSALRNSQQAAYADAVAYCVTFNTTASTFAIFRSGCSGTQVGQTRALFNGHSHLVSASFEQTDGTFAPQVIFTPRGSASPGGVVVSRDGSSKTYTISVEGLTGRVSAS